MSSEPNVEHSKSSGTDPTPLLVDQSESVEAEIIQLEEFEFYRPLHPDSRKPVLHRLLAWVFPMEFSDFAMFLLTAAIAWSALTGGKDTSRIAGSTEKQATAAEEVAKSANKQADAAQQFADTADEIDANINDAVKKLNLQAGQTRRLAENSAIANDLLKQQLVIQLDVDRPILQIFDLAPREGTPSNLRVVERNVTQFQFRIKNTGVGEAVNVRYAISGPHPIEVDRLLTTQISRSNWEQTNFEKSVLKGLMPNILGHDEARDAVPVQTASLPDVYIRNFGKGEYYLGRLTWDDAIGTGHWEQGFCIEVGEVNPKGIMDCGITLDTHTRSVNKAQMVP